VLSVIKFGAVFWLYLIARLLRVGNRFRTWTDSEIRAVTRQGSDGLPSGAAHAGQWEPGMDPRSTDSSTIEGQMMQAAYLHNLNLH
jgi:hypothetical protein